VIKAAAERLSTVTKCKSNKQVSINSLTQITEVVCKNAYSYVISEPFDEGS
jgi:hypothetical protein